MTASLLTDTHPVIGMVHLAPLPGSPAYAGSMDAIFRAALQDLQALEKGGANAAIIENFGDVPYSQTPGLPALAAMSAIAARLRQASALPLGLNVQFNCHEAEWAIAYACGLDFIRVEAFVETRAGAHGIALPAAPALMRLRAALPADIAIFADINVKHSFPLAPQPIEFSIPEAVNSGADALVVTGMSTGQQPTLEDVRRFKALAGDTPVLLGSGISAENAASFFEVADGAIVGSSLKKGGLVQNPIDEARVRQFMAHLGR